MLQEMPKHKASEKLQSDLKQKISRLKKEIETERKQPAGKGTVVRIPRQGAGVCILLGGPSAGKSRLLAALTRATPEVAPYPFTTRTPLPGMLRFEDVQVQLIDTPAITGDMLEPYLQGMIRGADVACLVVDLGADEGIEQAQAVLDRLNQTKTRLARTTHLDEDDVGLSYTQTLLVPNKLDAPGAEERLALLHELCAWDLAEYPVSAETAQGLGELSTAIYRALDVVRVYTKLPTAKQPDLDKPFTVRRGETLFDLAGLVHKDVQAKLKFARVWGTAVHEGSQVRPDYVLHDKDIVELHTG